MQSLSFLAPLDWIALSLFIIFWVGYTLVSKSLQKSRPTIANQLAASRIEWIEQMIEREVRISDITSLGILQRNVTFFASTTIFIIAGLLTVLGSSDKAIQLLSALPWIEVESKASWELKVLLLVVSFSYAFFKFTWAMRQYNFSIVLFGAAPEANAAAKDKALFTKHCNWLLTRATNSFNYGLRCYSFAIAALCWFINAWFFIGCTLFVVAVLYRREFKSSTLAALYNASHHNSEKPLSDHLI
ncbi:DUF599 domain-containing protein [Kangiella sp. TOML190]|uniref:DUF599 domain-containing protein n=1 Tax=Kangiella sp. TOML190 TaxID=2931351 RepID=UPI0020404C5B|nr:DUF599 domain-containing protein [Kangiella sp. TOML190]